jgi:hypothetical protein
MVRLRLADSAREAIRGCLAVRDEFGLDIFVQRPAQFQTPGATGITMDRWNTALL